MELRGTVVRRPFGVGTKSEHQAVMLATDRGTFRLRRAGGNPFHDPELERLVGTGIVCQGAVHNDTVLMTSWAADPDRG